MTITRKVGPKVFGRLVFLMAIALVIPSHLAGSGDDGTWDCLLSINDEETEACVYCTKQTEDGLCKHMACTGDPDKHEDEGPCECPAGLPDIPL